MKSDLKTKKLALAGLMAALSFAGYVIFPAINAFGLKVHVGNTFVVLAALLLGGPAGGLAGAVGLSLADLASGWAATAPVTFVCKLLIGLASGGLAAKVSLNAPHPKNHILRWTVLSSLAGLLLNCVTDPVLNYLWERFIMKGAEAVLSVNFLVTLVNAAVNTVLATALYLALRPAAKKEGII